LAAINLANLKVNLKKKYLGRVAYWHAFLVTEYGTERTVLDKKYFIT